MINSNKKNTAYDIAIIGAGLVGSIQALLLAEQGFNIILLDAAQTSNNKYLEHDLTINQNIPPDLRMSAITLKSEEVLTQIGVWDKVQLRAGIMQKTHIWEESGPGEITFDSMSLGRNYLATIVENNFLLELIREKIKTIKNIMVVDECKIKDINFAKNTSSKITTQESSYTVNLVIGADGANSWVRNYYQCECEFKKYNQSALIANVYTEKPHKNIAYQCFLKDGPLAFLPWSQSNCCSIVWSQSLENADYRLHCPEDAFHTELEKFFSNQLGKVTASSKRVCFPLVMRHATQYHKNGSVLIGDAAHVIHPMAGQGLNLGIYDALELANALSWAKNKQYNIASAAVLEKYQLKRRGHNQQMIDLMAMFKELYSNENKGISLIRNLGTNLLNSFHFAKKHIALYAAGL